MKKIFILGITVLMVSFGMLFVSCDDGGNGGNGDNGKTIKLYSRGGTDWSEWLSDDFFVKDYWNGTFTNGKKYEITITGNLDKQIPYLEFAINLDGWKEDKFYMKNGSQKPIPAGQFNIVFDHLGDDAVIDDSAGLLSQNKNSVKFHFKSNWSDTTFSGTDGAVMATITNFNMFIIEK